MKRMFSLGIICVVVLALPACSESKDEKKADVVVTTTTTTTIPLPAFTETPETLKIPNPCEVISIEHIENIISNATQRGPLIQNAVVASKACEWTKPNKDYPRVGVSIVLSPTVYDAIEATKVADAVVGDKAFIVDGFVTAFGGTSCGQTIIVKLRAYSYSVAVCNAKDKKPSDKELIELATDVQNSLP
ncbi:MAG TPA: hypothetical protein PKB15_00535 [Acidimicrobiia bacterium]|nr:hypothetical protein [Acidimicrobiia bacterium]